MSSPFEELVPPPHNSPPPSDTTHAITITSNNEASSNTGMSGTKDPLLPSQKSNLPQPDVDVSDTEHEALPANVPDPAAMSPSNRIVS